MTLQETYRVLEECAAISTESGELFYPHLSELTGEIDNEFAHFEWEDDEGLVYSVRFAEGENQSVVVSGGMVTLVDTEGDENCFYILGPMDIKSFLLSVSQE